MNSSLLRYVLAFVFVQSATAQVSQKPDLDKLPPQWVWRQGKYGSQWMASNPIQQELKRIFQPSLPDGIHATFGVAWGSEFLMGPGTPKGYSPYLMLKKYEYVSATKQIRPEGETGCWIYFQPNTLTMLHWKLPGLVHKMRYQDKKTYLFVCNIRIENDAIGNSQLYTDSYGSVNSYEGYCFSANNRIPVRRLTRKELFNSYKIYMDDFWDELIVKYEKSMAADEKNFNAMSAEQKKAESYWPELLQRNKNTLNEYRQNKKKLADWYREKMQSPQLDSPAVVENVFENIDVDKLDVAKGFNVWMDDPTFFDKTKGPDVPQFLFLHVRRQDSDLPKRLFVDRFSEAFNLDFLGKMTGMAPKKPGSLNTINESVGTEKTETKLQQESTKSVRFDFQNEPAGNFPTRWNGMKNIALEQYEGSNWLALSKAGYWYPKQFNKTIEDGFELSFNLSWNKEISYYNGLFAVTLAALEYDNATQGFKTAGTAADFHCFFDSYTADFNRIVLQFDPHFNSRGHLEVTVYDKRNISLLKQKVLLPDFYREKNQHHIQISRSGNKLIVKNNGNIIGTFDGVFAAGTRFNAYIFSRYHSNNEEASDTYYLNNIEAKY